MVPIVSKVGNPICHGCNLSSQSLLTAFLLKFHSVAAYKRKLETVGHSNIHRIETTLKFCNFYAFNVVLCCSIAFKNVLNYLYVFNFY
jgi:hypothetical protein